MTETLLFSNADANLIIGEAQVKFGYRPTLPPHAAIINATLHQWAPMGPTLYLPVTCIVCAVHASFWAAHDSNPTAFSVLLQVSQGFVACVFQPCGLHPGVLTVSDGDHLHYPYQMYSSTCPFMPLKELS